MSTDLARELDHRYRTRFANDERKKFKVTFTSGDSETYYAETEDRVRQIVERENTGMKIRSVTEVKGRDRPLMGRGDEGANDAQKPYISKLGNEWQLLDSNGKVVKSASSMQALQGDLDRLLLASRDEGAKTLNPQKVKGGAIDAEGGLGPGYRIAEMEKALAALKARLRTTAGSERRDIEQDIQRLEFQLRERKRENTARDVEPLAMPPAK